MANYSDSTRKEQVKNYLMERAGEWVDGPELANERVGGSEGLKRLRELRSELSTQGIVIVMRAHPDEDRDIFQYKLMMPPPPEEVVSPRRPPIVVDDANRYTSLPKGLAFGDAVMCHRCHARTKQIFAEGYQLFRDPEETKERCHGCNGWGIVPVAPAGHRVSG